MKFLPLLHPASSRNKNYLKYQRFLSLAQKHQLMDRLDELVFFWRCSYCRYIGILWYLCNFKREEQRPMRNAKPFSPEVIGLDNPLIHSCPLYWILFLLRICVYREQNRLCCAVCQDVISACFCNSMYIICFFFRFSSVKLFIIMIIPLIVVFFCRFDPIEINTRQIEANLEALRIIGQVSERAN